MQLESKIAAYDISPTAIEWCQKRFPGSNVQYVVANVLSAPTSWRDAFDFVLESYTLQVLPPDVRAQAMPQIASLVSARGSLLVIARGRQPEEAPGAMPWPLTRAEVERLQRQGLHIVQFEDYSEQEELPVRRFRVLLRREH